MKQVAGSWSHLLLMAKQIFSATNDAKHVKLDIQKSYFVAFVVRNAPY